MAIDKFLPSVLLEGIDEHMEDVGNELTEGHSTSDACAETNLQSPLLIEKVDQAPVRLLKSALFLCTSGSFITSLFLCAQEVLTSLKTNFSFSGIPKGFLSAQWLQSTE